MIHPSREDLIGYAYGELRGDAKSSVHTHVHACADCRSAVDGWRATMRDLDGWNVQVRPARKAAPFTLLNWQPLGWAVAAMLALGFVLGWAAAPGHVDAAAIRAEVQSTLRDDLRKEFLADVRAALSGEPVEGSDSFRHELKTSFDQWADNRASAAASENGRRLAAFAETLKAARAEDQQAFLAAVDKLDRQHRLDNANLRKAIETVALNTEGYLVDTREKLGQLATYARWDGVQPSDRVIPVNNSTR